MGNRKPTDETAAPPTQARRLMRLLGLRPKKGLGQHFLTDSRVLRHIVQAAELSPSDIILEVGPGLGILTRELAARAGRVIAIEKDETLATALGKELATHPNLRVIPGDILELDIPQVLASQTGLSRETLAFQYKVIANLPYYIASAVVRRLLEADVRPKLMVVMVQKEVAEAMVAKPGQMRLLSVGVQFYGQARIVARVTPRSFYPPPKVHSAVVRVVPSLTTPLPAEEVSGFFHVVRAGFSAPRKQVHNSLAQGLGISSQQAMIYLEKAGIDPKRRAQTLSLAEWVSLWNSVRDIKGI